MFISKLTRKSVTEGQGVYPDGPWLGEAVYRIGYIEMQYSCIEDFIHKLYEYKLLLLNKGMTNNEIVAQFVLGTLTLDHLRQLRFIEVERVK